MLKLKGGFIMQDRRTFIKKLGIVTAGSAIAPRLAFGAGHNSIQSVSILHTNDLHCHFMPFSNADPKYPGKGGMNRISAYVKMLRKQNPNTLLFDSGDFSQGTPYYNFYKGEVALKLMSEMGYNVGTVGNHEFDNGLDSFSDILQYANFPIISSNYDFSKTVLNDKIKRYHIIEQNDIRIGVYGLGIKLSGLVNPDKSGDTVYNDPLHTALEMEEFLKTDKKCNLIICLSHLGYKYEEDLISDLGVAANTNCTDLILGGHTHTFLPKPVEVSNKKGMTVVVNQVGWAALMLGQMTFYFEKQKKSYFNKSDNKTIE